MTSLLDRQRERFLANPDDGQAFAALEEELHLAGQWDALIEVYRCRIDSAALADTPIERAQLQLRMGQVRQDRCDDLDEALECYREALLADSKCRPAMLRMRKLHTTRGQWEIALQIAEVEVALPQPSPDRARVLSEMGTIWLDHLGDRDAALGFFSRALAEHPEDLDALEGSARAFDADGHPEQAADAWDLAIDLLRGPARAKALICRARLASGPLENPIQAIQFYRRALTDEPNNTEALEAVVARAKLDEQWILLPDLQERRFELESDVGKRAQIAIEIGRLQLEQLENIGAAQLWFERAAELAPDDPVTCEVLADLARERGDDDALLHNLERAAKLWSGNPPVSMLIELAALHTDAGDANRALGELEMAFEAAPDDSLVAEALCEVLSLLGRDEQMIEVLEQRATLAGSDNELRAVALAELGSVLDERLADTSGATDAYERAFEADPSCPGVLPTLERLHRKAEDWQSLRSLLERAADIAPPPDRVAHLCTLAAILSEHFDEGAEATQVLERVLEIDPDTSSAHLGLQHLAAESGDEDAQLRAFEREAQIAAPSRLVQLVAELVPRFEALGDFEAALGWAERWRAAQPDNAAAHSECARLHEVLGHDAELSAVLEALDPHLDGIDRVANQRRLAGLHMRFDRPDAAIETYQSALQLDPLDAVTLESLAVALLASGRIEELANVKRQIAGLVSLTARIACLDELALLVADRLGDVNGAIEILLEVQRETTVAGIDDGLAPSDLDDRLEDYLERTARFEELATQLAMRAARFDRSDPEWASLRRAGVLFDDLNRFDDAAAAYRSAYEADKTSEPARDGLERALRASGDPSGLAEFLGEQMALASSAEIRDQCAFERALLLEETLDREPESLELYQQLASACEDPDLRKQATQRLEEQLERNEQWELLRAHLESALGDESEGDCRVHERLGTIYREQLRNWPRAIDQFEAAATIAPERADLWRILASLYEQQGQIDSLVSAIEAEIATGPDLDRELTLRSRAAELCVHPLEDQDRAQEHYEQILLLDRTHSAASDFLLDYWERKGNSTEVIGILEARLVALEQPSDDRREWPKLRASLRLRIAGIQATELDDIDAAIRALEPTLAELGPEPFVAEPLADLYRRGERIEELVELCAEAAVVSNDGNERACWFARQGAALKHAGRDRDAAHAYRNVLTARPDDRDAQAELCDLYRKLEDHEPLVRLLELELSRLAGDDEIPVRLELAGLLEAISSRRSEALIHLKRVLALRSDHTDALDRALDLAERLHRDATHSGTGAAEPTTTSTARQHTETLLELLETALRQPQLPAERAAHLARRARLSTQVFDRKESAIADYREALTLDPRADVTAALRELLSDLGRWDQVLDCVFKQTHGAEASERIALYEQAIEIAWDRVNPESALPWLERLRSQSPDDPAVIRRIAEVHRLAGRPEATLRSLECELALIDEPIRQLELHRERARILEVELGFPGRAVAALEDAERVAPGDSGVLQALCGLYQKLGRPRQHARALSAWIDSISDDAQRLAAMKDLAGLFMGPLASPRKAGEQLWKAVALVPANTPQHGEILRELGQALRAAGDGESWARCAEQELHILDCEKDVFAERRIELHRELARTYEHELGRPDTALEHLVALVDSGAATDPDPTETAQSSTLLRLLRVQGNWIELEKWLSEHLSQNGNDPAGWLELARLRDERMHWTGPAAEAYRQVLALEPDDIAALRGLRSAAERQGNWSEVAQTLEDELEHIADASGANRAAIARELGDLNWRQLESTTRASRWYAAALEANPSDLQSLRSLQQLLEAMEDWRGALDLYDSEIEMLGDTEPERRAEISIRTARHAAERTHQTDRAIRAYEYAADISPLEPVALRSLAELYASNGDPEACARNLAAWCDREDSGAAALDHLELATTLQGLGREPEALERIERAVGIDPELVPAWDLAAQLRENAGDNDGAGEALSIAAELGDDHEACTRLIRAAQLCSERAPSIAAARLRTAIHREPGNVEAHARLAVLAFELGEFGEAELCAGRALDLETAGRLDRDLHLNAALAGGRAAVAVGRLQSAVRCLAIAIEIEPENPEALAEYGKALAEHGDVARSREVLEQLLAQDGPNDERPLHLSLVARAHQQSGDFEAASQSFEEAIAADPRFEPAHEGLVAMWKSNNQLEPGITCLERWADVAASPNDRAERLLQAAEWELDAGDPNETAEQHLREVLDTNPSALRPWEALTALLWDQGRGEDALQVASLAMNGVEGSQASTSLALIQGRALEQIGEREEAAVAFQTAAIADPGCVEAALSRARLLRALGDWRAAADTLREFSNRHDGNDAEGLSEVLQQLGRLYAGPLEDADRAIAVYRRAIALNPDRLLMRAALSEFLSHRPADWPEALAHHQWVLNADPTHHSSLRVLMRISREHENRATYALSVAITNALGQVSPADLEEDFSSDPPCFSGVLELADPLWETVRGVIVEAASEIATSLDASDPSPVSLPNDTVAAFHAAAVAAEGRLSAPALLPLADREFANLVQIVCALALDEEQIQGDGSLVNALSSALKRRTRRRLRRRLEGISMDSINQIDFREWRSAIRAMAQSVSIDETRIEFGNALLSVASRSSGDRTRDAIAGTDLAPVIADSREAAALLRRAIGTWLGRL